MNNFRCWHTLLYATLDCWVL